jgi:hypothetical protein
MTSMLRGMLSSIPAAEVFVYTGPGGERVPDDVVRVRVHQSVVSIPDQGNNYGDKTVGARENDLLRICLFLKKENFH